MKQSRSYIVEMTREGKTWKLHTTDVEQAVGKVKNHIKDDDVIAITIKTSNADPQD